MQARWGGFTVRVDCPRCGQPVPLNAPVDRAHCAACAGDFAVPVAVYAHLLTDFDDAFRRFGEGDVKSDNRLIDGLQAHTTCRRRAPACKKCGADLGLEGAGVSAWQTSACRQCGDPAAFFEAPAWLRGAVPSAALVAISDVSAAPGFASGPAPDAPNPIAMPCPQCGAALHLTSSSERVVRCGYCATDVYLPDDLWRRLHPARTVAPWFVRFEGASRAERAAAEAAREEAEREAQKRYFQGAREAAAAADAVLLDEGVARLTRAAYGPVLVFIGLLVTDIGWLALSPVYIIKDTAVGVGAGITALTLLALIVAVAVASRPLKQRTGYDGTAMMFVSWFFLIFALVMPAVGQVMALFVAIKRFRGTFGGVTISSGSGSQYYPPIRLTHGEGYPLGCVYLAMALLWPLLWYFGAHLVGD